uniref:Methylated-DNA-protein-cysteine methyltransferase n=1 Tax=Kwoniella bestiolae CBS 10118 TaxID=1296100 RepID=A0A1B9FXL9_9TREE|nr:methylated-DNA-protein-cysteine methyltransferase [Kwoniella bestiolae CBS 10118]OCF23519.1 methylated-DNA-protein-cysteine methyltransferase [Kwoniella bestiolae CBS 10118]
MSDIADLTAKTYEITRLIPHGRVTSYGRKNIDDIILLDIGHIAKLAGYPRYSRHVGNALKALPPNTDIPWQRVINSKGLISPRGDLGEGVARQKDRLENEGVQVDTLMGNGGEKVDLRLYGWFPESLDGLEQEQ